MADTDVDPDPIAGTTGSSRPPASSLRATLVSAGVSIVTMLPMFLTGALVVPLTQDLQFGAVQLGGAVASFRLASVLTLPFLGRLADRVGAVRSLRIAAITAGVASAGVALAAPSYATLVAWLMVGGCAQAIGQPAANRYVSQRVAPERMGVAFGVKQAANPTASMLAGLSVPVLASSLGWRWAYGFTAIGAALFVVAVGRSRGTAAAAAATAEHRPMNRRVLTLFLCTFGLSVAVAGSVPTFFVAAAVDAGASADFAGTFLAVASAGAVIMRLVSGWACDRISHGHLRLFAGGLAVGSLGLVLLATGEPVVMTIGALIALTATWGFNGVFWYSVIRENPQAPGAVTGAVLPGGNIGGIVGPVMIGAIVTVASYRVAWLLVAVLSLVASYAMYRGSFLVSEIVSAPSSDADEAPDGE